MKLHVGQYRNRKIGYIVKDGDPRVMVSAMDISRYPLDTDPECLYFIGQASATNWERKLGKGATLKEDVIFKHWKKKQKARLFLDVDALLLYLLDAELPTLLDKNKLMKNLEDAKERILTPVSGKRRQVRGDGSCESKADIIVATQKRILEEIDMLKRNHLNSMLEIKNRLAKIEKEVANKKVPFMRRIWIR